MELPKTILCCFPLRTGCLILGYVTLILTLMEILVILADMAISVKDYFDGFYRMDIIYTVITALFIIPHVFVLLPWVGINIACIIGIHKRSPNNLRRFTKYMTYRFGYMLFIHLCLLLLSGILGLVFLLISFETSLSMFYLLNYYWYVAEVNSSRGSNEPHSVITSESTYMEEIPPLMESNKDVIIS